MVLVKGDNMSNVFTFLKEETLTPKQVHAIVWSLVIITLSFGFIYLALYPFHRRRQLSVKSQPEPVKSPPGPACAKIPFSPVLVWHEFRGNRRLYIHSLHERYGDAVRIGYNEYSFASVQAVSTIYGSRPVPGENVQELDKSSFYSLFELYGVKTTFSTLGRTEHFNMVKAVSKPYRYSEIKNAGALPGIENRADAFVREVNHKHGCMDVYEYLHCYALDCASHFLLGGREGTRSIEFEQDKRIIREMSYHDSLKNQLAHFYTPTFLTGFMENILPHRLNPLADAYVRNACQRSESGSSEPNESYSLLHQLETCGEFPPDHIPAEIMDHLAAGIDTTGDALCFIMYLLSLPHNQNIQDELRKQLNVAKDKDEYLEAVIAEGLRCFPPIPMSQPRIVPSGGIPIDGYDVPGKSIVSVQAWSLHRNPKNFEDPDEFRPERWLLPTRKAIAELERAFFAFGTGSRRCMGRNLAMAEMRCILNKIYSKFTTSIDPRWTTHVEDMQMADQIIASRPKGQKCLLKFKLLGTVERWVKLR